MSHSLITPLLLGPLMALSASAWLAAAEDPAESGAEPTPLSAGPAVRADAPAAAASQQGAPASEAAAEASPAQQETEIAEAVAAGKVLKDMTMQQVRQARGEPNSKEIIPPDAELWRYEDGEVAFSAGKVSYLSLATRAKPITVLQPSDPIPAAEDSAQSEEKRPSQVTAPPITVGDTYIYESRALGAEASEAGAVLSTRRTVTACGDTVTMSLLNLDNKNAKPRTLELNREWNLVKSRNASGSGLDFSPPLKYFDFPLFRGKTWRQTTTERNIETGAVREHTLSGTVGPWEEITVPAGTFMGIRVELQTDLFDPSTGERIIGTDTSWYVPKVRRSVKSMMTGKGGRRQLIQLISYRLGQQ